MAESAALVPRITVPDEQDASIVLDALTMFVADITNKQDERRQMGIGGVTLVRAIQIVKDTTALMEQLIDDLEKQQTLKEFGPVPDDTSGFMTDTEEKHNTD